MNNAHQLRTVIVWILALIAIQFNEVKSDENENALAADLFKNFIHQPPPIKDLFIEHVDPGQYPSSYYRVKWQPECMFVACLRPDILNRMQLISNLVDYPTIYSKYTNIYWEKQFRDLYSWTNKGIIRQETNSITFSSVFFLQTVVMPVLCGGCDFIPIGGISWNGDTFVYTNNTRRFWVKGTLSRDDGGRASKLVLSICRFLESVPIKNQYYYNYYYDNPLALSFLPSRIERHDVDEDGKDWIHTVIIHSIEISPEPMPKNEFSLDSLSGTTNIGNLITVSNNMLVVDVINPAQGVIAHGVRQDPVAPKLYTDNKMIIIRIILFMALILPVVYYFLAGSTKTNNK